MIKTRITGIALIGLGTIQHSAGTILRNRRLQAVGFGRKVSGQSKLAIGSAMLRVVSRLQAAKDVSQHRAGV